MLSGIFSFPVQAQSATPAGRSGWLLVVSKGEHALDIVDPAIGKKVASISTHGNKAHEVATSPHGRTAYVPIYGSAGVGKPGTDGANIVVINLKSRTIVGNVEFPHGVRPHLPVFDAKRNVLYVTTELDHTISIIDLKTLKIVGSIPTGQAESHMFVLSHDGQRGYTANVGPGTVSVLDLEHRKLLKIIPVSQETQRIAIAPDDSMVFTSDQRKPQLAVIDAATNKVKTWVPLPALGYGAAATPDGHWLLVAMPDANQVAVVDLRRMKVARTIGVCGAPQEVLIQPNDPATAYVSCESTGNVAVLNLDSWKMEKTIEVGAGPDGMAWANDN